MGGRDGRGEEGGVGRQGVMGECMDVSRMALLLLHH